MQEILQQFASGAAGVPEDQTHGHVSAMLAQAPPQHAQGAIEDALQALGAHGFGQSVAQAAQGMGPQQQQGIVNVLGQAIESDGGSLSGVLNQFGLGGGSGNAPTGGYNAGALGQLASYALQNHGGALSSLLGSRSSSGGSEVLRLLGNPMVRQVGISLAQRLLSNKGL